jgi:hypothetical protein
MKFSTPEGTKKIFVIGLVAAISYSIAGPIGLAVVALYLLLAD